VILLGHSRGGAIAILHVASDIRSKALVTWSAIASLDRWTKHQKELWRKVGNLPLSNDTSVSPLRLGIGLLNDLELNSDKLNVINAASKIKIPWLLVHGKTDVLVPQSEAEQLYHVSNQSTTKLALFEKVGHLYNASSREEDNYQTINKILEYTINWIKHNLS
jgi:uncharacterized protein